MRNGKGTISPSSPAMSTCPSSHIDHASSSKDPDRLLPIANVSRLMKKSLPTNAKISKEAKESVQECVSEFISFITCEASDKCLREKRKTINGDDLLWAMTTLGFENYISPLKNYLSKFRELEEDKSSMGRQAQEATNSTNGYHHQQQVQQLNIMNNNNNGYMCVGDFDKVVNFGGNGEKQFDDGHMGVEDFDKVVNFGGGIGNKRLLQESNFSGGSRADDHHDHMQQHLHLGSSNNGFVTTDNGAKLSHGVQW